MKKTRNFIIYASYNFIVMPTTGDSLKGGLLITPREPMTELSSELRKEFLAVIKDATDMLKLTYPIAEVSVSKEANNVHIAPSKLISEEYNLFSEDEDRETPSIITANATYNDVQKALLESWAYLPTRIQMNTKKFLVF